MQNPPTAKAPEWTILKLLRWTTSYFQSRGIDSPRADAEILLAHALNLDRIDLYLKYDQPMFSEELGLYRSLIKRRANREPVAYIVGTKEFWSLPLSVTDAVLIPRPETEILVEKTLELLKSTPSPDSGQKNTPIRILEIGTGSGAVILALASEAPGQRFFASDISQAAIDQARSNAVRHRLDGQVSFFISDLFQELRDTSLPFQIIVSNPPYIESKILGGLQPEISRYEPQLALDGKADGLFYVRQIIHEAHPHLAPGGYLLLEIGHDQKPATQQIIDDTGLYDDIAFTKDYGGFDRVVSMRKRQRT